MVFFRYSSEKESEFTDEMVSNTTARCLWAPSLRCLCVCHFAIWFRQSDENMLPWFMFSGEKVSLSWFPRSLRISTAVCWVVSIQFLRPSPYCRIATIRKRFCCLFFSNHNISQLPRAMFVSDWAWSLPFLPLKATAPQLVSASVHWPPTAQSAHHGPAPESW